MPKATVKERISGRLFSAMHRRSLVYNCCWEDPALDRVALDLRPDDAVVVITSAGCNALDYALAGAGEVNAVDMNPIQNALLELKVAGVRRLDHASFWELFGTGSTPRASEMYLDALRPDLSPVARRYWDKHINFFNGKGWRGSFYHRGTSGLLAKVVLTTAQRVSRLRKPLDRLMDARTLDEQRAIYRGQIERKFWNPMMRWMLSRSLTLALAGVPYPQRQQLREQYPGGVVRFVRDSVEAIATELPFWENYFWRVYVQGHYEPECCPEYLKPANFERLKAGVIDRVKIHTDSITGFLREREPGTISKFVLLDHMDWLSLSLKGALAEEWEAILSAARPGSRVIFRSAGVHVDFLDNLEVNHRGQAQRVGDLLTYHRELAADLHRRDRVHTYTSFHVADLPSDTGSA